jgi:DHA3 family macrolide efflux protein-like MFS transporter
MLPGDRSGKSLDRARNGRVALSRHCICGRQSGPLITFIVLWLGQLVSLVGSGLTSFALGVWTFQRTGSTTQFALIGLSAVLPRVILSPLAGVVVDRWDRRRIMLLSDVGAGLSTLVIALLISTGRLQVWHIYLLTSANAACSAFQWPAYMATTTLLIPKKNLGRANGMIQFGQAASEILSPALAGVLIQTIHMDGVILIDVMTCVFAVVTLGLIRFPKPAGSKEPVPEGESIWRRLGFGWRYLTQRPALMELMGFLAMVNFIWGMVGALVAPMVLSWASSEVLGLLLSVAGVGMLTGSLLMSVWGGPKRRIEGVLHFELISGICFVLMGISPSFWPIAVGAFGAHLTIAIVYGSNHAIWQSKIEPEFQGRVFATQQMVLRATTPLAYLFAGPLADRLFNPLLDIQGPLASSVGRILDSGPGRGIGLMFVLMGVVKIVLVAVGKKRPRLQRLEEELPDVIIS